MTIYAKSEIQESVKKITSFLSSFIDKNKILFYDSKKLHIKSQIQTLLKAEPSDDLDKIVLEIILENAFKAENLTPGGFCKTIESLNTVKRNSKTYDSFHARREDIERFCEKNLPNLDSKMLMNALDEAGFTGKITLEKSPNDACSVEVVDSYNFGSNSFFNSNVKLIKPKIVLIDGYVESVSEINRLLESATNAGYQLILATRGFDNEVVHTINVNNNRKVFSIYPVQIPFDLDGLNTMVDISIASGCELISSNLGQLISAVDMSNSETLDEASLTKNKISFKKKSTKTQVRTHVNNLLRKLAENPSTSEIYEKRISSLNCNNVVIRLPDDSKFVERSNAMDLCLRSVKSMMDYGVSKDCDIFAARHVSTYFADLSLSTLDKLEFVVKDFSTL